MAPAAGGTLVAVLMNPPLSGGKRTLNRVTLAADLLGFDEAIVANMFALPSQSTGVIADLGVTQEGWVAARTLLAMRLDVAHGVLLGYGATPPTGAARLHFRDQVAWLRERVNELSVPTCHVGDGPRHPSRWQRWTHRAHPDVPFVEALRRSLVQVAPEVVSDAT